MNIKSAMCLSMAIVHLIIAVEAYVRLYELTKPSDYFGNCINRIGPIRKNTEDNSNNCKDPDNSEAWTELIRLWIRFRMERWWFLIFAILGIFTIE